MEAIKSIAISVQPERSSQTDVIAEIPVEKQRAMGDVFDRWRLNCGWNPWDDKTQDLAIASFVATLDREGIPCEVYNELYERGIQARTAAMSNGKELPKFGAELLLAQWPGLRDEIRAEQNKRALSVNAESQCPDCYGSGFRDDEKDGYRFVRKCNHDGLGTGR